MLLSLENEIIIVEKMDGVYMFIKKGSIVSIRELTPTILKNKSKRDINIINNAVKRLKVKYLICLRKIDDTHFLCAFIRHHKYNHGIPIKFNNEENLWVNYAIFIDVNLDFIKIEINSNEYLYRLVSEIYTEHNAFVIETQAKKKERVMQKKEKITKKKEQKRKEILKKHKLAKIKRLKKLYGNPNDPRTNNNPIEVVKMSGTSKRASYSSIWWNVNHPVSGGRGNF